MVKKEIKKAAHEKLIREMNSFRPREWQIDIDTMTFRGEKVYLSRIGRYILANGFDIYAEYHTATKRGL